MYKNTRRFYRLGEDLVVLEGGKGVAIFMFLEYFCVSGFNPGAGNIGSYRRERIEGDFLSSQKSARAERCPPKTTGYAFKGVVDVMGCRCFNPTILLLPQ